MEKEHIDKLSARLKFHGFDVPNFDYAFLSSEEGKIADELTAYGFLNNSSGKLTITSLGRSAHLKGLHEYFAELDKEKECEEESRNLNLKLGKAQLKDIKTARTLSIIAIVVSIVSAIIGIFT